MAGSGRTSARSRIKPTADASDGDDSLRNAKRNLKARKGRSRDHSYIRIFDVNLKVVLGMSAFAFLVILFLIRHLVNPAGDARRPRVVTPFPAPKVMDLPQVECCLSLFTLLYHCLSSMYNLAMTVSRRAPRELVLGNLSPSCLPWNSCEVLHCHCDNFTRPLILVIYIFLVIGTVAYILSCGITTYSCEVDCA